MLLSAAYSLRQCQALVSQCTVLTVSLPLWPHCPCSHDEKELLKQYCPTCNVAIISNIHDFTPANTSCVGRSGIMFVGNFNHLPNQQAVTNLIEYIVPLIKALLPSGLARDFKLHVVGSNAVPVAIQELAAKHRETVVLHGWLSDELLRVLYSRVKVVVAPLLSGAGVKGKVGIWQCFKEALRCACNSLLHN